MTGYRCYLYHPEYCQYNYEHLCAFPEMGRCVELSPTPDAIRDFVFGDYIVRYALHSQSVVVLRIWHHYETRV